MRVPLHCSELGIIRSNLEKLPDINAPIHAKGSLEVALAFQYEDPGVNHCLVEIRASSLAITAGLGRSKLASLFYHGQSHPLSGGLKGNNPISDFDNPQNPSK